MGVLDTFVFMLKADEKNAVRGIKDAGEAFEDLKKEGQKSAGALSKLLNGLKPDTEKLKTNFNELGKSISESIGSNLNPMGLAGPLLAGAAAGMSFHAILENVNKELERAQEAEMVGIDVGKYQELESAFGALGVEADAMRDSLVDLNESMGEAMSDASSGKAKAFQALGVSVKDAAGKIKPTEDALLDLAGAMEHLDKQKATFQIKQLGITDNAVIMAMMSGRHELERLMNLRKALGTQTEEDTKRAKEFHTATSELNMIMSAMADELTRDVAPALTVVVDAMTAVVMWARDHSAFLLSFLGILGVAALPMVTTALWGMATAAWAAIAPFLPFIAIAAALALVIEDLWTYFHGGESAIGDLAAKFPLLKEVLDDAGEAMGWLKDIFLRFADDPKKAMSDFVQWLHGLWSGMVADTEQIFTEMLNWIIGIFDKLGDQVSEKLDALKKMASNPIDTVGSWFSGGDSTAAANQTLGSAASAPAVPSVQAVAAGGGGSRTNQVSQHIDKVEVNVSNGDPTQVKQGVKDGLDSHLKGVASGLDDGRSH